MYIIKNALRCISRSKGRNILIGMITLVIAISACLGLSIRQASESAKADTLENLEITASISFDRQSMMNNMRPSDMGGGMPDFDRSEFKDMMGGASSLTLSEYQTYAAAETVKDFYYTITASVNGSDDLDAVSTDAEEETSDTEEANNKDDAGFPDKGGMGMPGGFGGGMMNNMMGMSFSSGDFSIIGYSGENAMTDFINGNSSVTEGEIFEEGTTDLSCIISEELAIYNGIEVGDTITVTNPDDEEETYQLKVSGIYTSTQTNDSSMPMFSTSQDPANRIYMSAAALQEIINHSENSPAEEESESSVTTDAETSEDDEEETTAITGTVAATYVFADVADYEQFAKDVYTMGLDDSYTVSSADISAYESSLTPLETLSTMAGWFLVVILIIGAVVLVVLNIFNVRERKYEIGVLTAMGMKKSKVALQFITEILVVTMIAVILGAGVGAVSSVPVTNALLENQIAGQQNQLQQLENSFGRGEGMPDMPDMGGNMPPQGMGGMDFGSFMNNTRDYITEVDSAMNLTVVFQMLGIGLLLTLIASAFSVLFVMRYDPLKILANRD